jgi:outer membrane protein assembly factor BamB
MVNAQNGTVSWSKKIAGATVKAGNLVFDKGTQSVFVTGYDMALTPSQYYSPGMLVKYDASGNQIWKRTFRFGNPTIYIPSVFLFPPTGELFVTTVPVATYTQSGVCTGCYTASGEFQYSLSPFMWGEFYGLHSFGTWLKQGFFIGKLFWLLLILVLTL